MPKTTHGMTGTKVYKAWRGMLERCYDQSHPSYYAYGAKGISVCERWHDFNNFLSDVGFPPSSKHTLDRIESSRNYEVGNVRWATREKQQRNRGILSNNKSGYNGVSFHKCTKHWRACIGINSKTVHIGNAKTIEAALALRNQYIIDNNLDYKLQNFNNA